MTRCPSEAECRALKLLLTQPEASRSQGALVPGAGVLIGGDGHQLQHPLGPSPVDAFRPQVDQDQCHSHTSDGVIMWSALQGGEHREVDLVLKVVQDLLPLLVHRANSLTIENESGPEQNRAIS
ncbi:hypothetical protein EYF80_023432 [Liparis tanakae]|uniref:Uncharacterized protein n=1 Tax=Liparis tanakae TaxID=230148 RepID=A0A4Z2HN49_9TELE|nr:hypothetical protein EYF80_023432 [Liparis tanakae]